MKAVSTFALICLMSFVVSCQFSVREPGYTREQFVSDSTFITEYMLDSLPSDSRYVSLGLKLIKCEAFSYGRLVEHSFQSTNEVIPPAHHVYFHFTHDGLIQRIMTKDGFSITFVNSGSQIYSEEPYQ